MKKRRGAPGRDWLHCCLTSKHMFKLGNGPTLWHYYCQQQRQQGFGSRDTEEAVVSDWKAQDLQNYNRLKLFADTPPKLLVLSPDKLTVRKGANGEGHTRCRTARKWDSGKHYFEVTIKHTSDQIFIGIILTDRDTYCSIVGHWLVRGAIQWNSVRQPRQTESSTTIDCDFDPGDVIGVYLDIDAGDLLYFQNSSYLVGLRKAEEIREHKPYYAAVSLMFQDEEVTFRSPPSIPSFVQQHIAENPLGDTSTEEKETTKMFSELPFELQVECLKWLGGSPAGDWLHCCITSKSMLELCHDAALWHYFCCQQGLLLEESEEAVNDWKQHYLRGRIPVSPIIGEHGLYGVSS